MKALHMGRRRRANWGFTIIELLVVLAALALLLSVAAPRYMQHLDRAREVTLRENLVQTRRAIDQFYADQGRYPINLQELVLRKYLRSLPFDPLLERDDAWVLVPASAGAGFSDLRSGSTEVAKDGKPYSSW